MLINLHSMTAVVAIICGLLVFYFEKGSWKHVILGRLYAPTTNRFLSADTIIPDPANPQSFNRYSYVENSPVRYNDPSGHCGADTIQITNSDGTTSTAQDPSLLKACQDIRDPFVATHGIGIMGEWTFAEMKEILAGLSAFQEWAGEPLTEFITGIFQDREWYDANGYAGCYKEVQCYWIGPELAPDPSIPLNSLLLVGSYPRYYDVDGIWEGKGLYEVVVHEAIHGYANKYPGAVGELKDPSPLTVDLINNEGVSLSHAAEENYADLVARQLSTLDIRMKPRYGNGKGRGRTHYWFFGTSTPLISAVGPQ